MRALNVALACALCFIASARAAAPAPAAERGSELPSVISAEGFVCVSPAGQETRRQPIPPGKTPDDLCPAGDRLYLTYNPAMPRGLRPVPAPPPVQSSPQQQSPETQKLQPGNAPAKPVPP